LPSFGGALDELDILMNFTRGFPLDFPPVYRNWSVGTLGSFDVVAKMSVHVGAFSFKEDSRSVHGCRIQIGGAFQPFEAAHSLVHTVIEQEDSFVKMSFLHDNNPFSGEAASFGSECGASGHTSPLESSADPDGQTDSVGQNYGGGWATRKGMERATETKQSWAGCTQRANPILSIPAIVASNPGDFG
jgi:hypothetical protein